jgi:prevent-host-death family protein
MKGHAMQVMNAKDAQARFGEALNAMQKEPVLITQNNQPVGMMVSLADLEGTHLADQFMAKEDGYDEWVQAKVGASLTRWQMEGSNGRSLEEAHTKMMDKVWLRIQN